MTLQHRIRDKILVNVYMKCPIPYAHDVVASEVVIALKNDIHNTMESWEFLDEWVHDKLKAYEIES